MARIRSIKPEFWQDEKLAARSLGARLLFIALWNFADDEGRMRAHPAFVKSQVFAYDDGITAAHVGELLEELNGDDLIHLYEADGQRYLWVRNFNKHQKIDKPSKSQLPSPPKREKSRAFAEHSPKPREDSRWDGMGVDGSGRERIVAAQVPAATLSGAAVVESASRPAAAPVGFQLEQTGPDNPPPKPSEHWQDREDLLDLRLLHLPDAAHAHEDWLPTAKAANAQLAKAKRWLAETYSLDPPAARDLLYQAATLYMREEWPGRMTDVRPWSFWVLLKLKHLAAFSDKARALEWGKSELGLWEPKRGAA